MKFDVLYAWSRRGEGTLTAVWGGSLLTAVVHAARGDQGCRQWVQSVIDNDKQHTHKRPLRWYVMVWINTPQPPMYTHGYHQGMSDGFVRLFFPPTWVGRSPCLTHVTVNDNARWPIFISRKRGRKYCHHTYIFAKLPTIMTIQEVRRQ